MSLKTKVKKLPSPKKPLLSVIIITLNEEQRLPILLDCLQKQTFKNFETIVADAGSKDKTRAIARRAGARVVNGGLPSRGRNAGAKAARAPELLFLDSDTMLSEGFIEQNLAEKKQKELGVATVMSKVDSGSLFSELVFGVWNIWIHLVKPFRPHAPGYCIFASRSLHKKIKGFDEKLLFAEDVDYAERAAKHSSFGFLSVPIVVSDRRYRRGNRWCTIVTSLKYEFYHLFQPSKKYTRFDYPLGEHPEQASNKKGR